MTRRRYLVWICAGWLVLALMRLLTNVASGSLTELSLLRLMAIVFPVAALWIPVSALILLVNRSRVASRPAALVGTHVGVAALTSLIEPFWLITVIGWLRAGRPYLEAFLSRLDINLLLYAIIVAADVAWLRLQALKQRELAAARLEQTLVDVQLHGLAIQLQPHFLFNALQFVAETAHDDLNAARRTLALLRGLVEQAFALEIRVEVTVAEEISFLRAYGEIQKSRFGDRFSLSMKVDDTALDGAIPPLLLQPLVENASRHGFARRGSGGHIEVTVRRTRGDMLSVVVADDGVGLSDAIKEGQGLTVTRRRLARLYGGDAHLSLARASDGRTESRLRFPYRVARAVSAERPVPVVAAQSPVESNGAFERIAARVPFSARVAAGWLGLILLLIIGTYAGVALHVFWPDALPGLKSLFLDEMVGAPFWIVLTIVAVVAARRLSGWWAIPQHALLACVVAVSHAALGGAVAAHVFNVPSSQSDYRFLRWAPWDVLVYVALVLLARAHDLGDWMRAKMREEVTLNEQVVHATTRLARLRETQSVLLTSLDEVIASPNMETLDRAVVEFADFLRIDVMAGVTE